MLQKELAKRLKARYDTKMDGKENHMQEFNKLLIEFNNSGNPDSLKEFLYNNAIEGINL